MERSRRKVLARMFRFLNCFHKSRPADSRATSAGTSSRARIEHSMSIQPNTVHDHGPAPVFEADRRNLEASSLLIPSFPVETVVEGVPTFLETQPVSDVRVFDIFTPKESVKSPVGPQVLSIPKTPESDLKEQVKSSQDLTSIVFHENESETMLLREDSQEGDNCDIANTPSQEVLESLKTISDSLFHSAALQEPYEANNEIGGDNQEQVILENLKPDSDSVYNIPTCNCEDQVLENGFLSIDVPPLPDPEDCLLNDLVITSSDIDSSVYPEFVPPPVMHDPFRISPAMLGLAAPPQMILPAATLPMTPARTPIQAISPLPQLNSSPNRWSERKPRLSDPASSQSRSNDSMQNDRGKPLEQLDRESTSSNQIFFNAPIQINSLELSAFSAVRHNKFEELERLISQFTHLIDARDQNNKGNTLLHVACSNGYARIAKLLIDSGANLDASNRDGNTPLHVSYQYGRYAIVSILIAAQADENSRNRKDRIPAQMLSGSFPSSLEVSPIKD